MTKKLWKKMGVVLMTLALVVSMMPQMAFGESGDTYLVLKWKEDTKEVISTQESIPGEATPIDNDYFTNGNNTTLNAGTYFVTGDNVTVNERININGSVNLILMDGCHLNASSGGISVNKDNSLTIYAQSNGDNMGKLTANGNYKYAGIGGDLVTDAGTITIHGGIIDAAGDYGAGIGGGGNSGDNADCGSGGTIIIYGGTVTASGGENNGAGIGGGGLRIGNVGEPNLGGAGGEITIYGGTITATGGQNGGAGIGGGGCNENNQNVPATGGAGGNITIYGGTIKANGGGGGAGIGGGGATDPQNADKLTGGSGGEINITGGTVNATGGKDYGAGIGGGGAPVSNGIHFGIGGAGGTTTISGGTVTATGGGNYRGAGAGIGAGGGKESTGLSSFSTGSDGNAFINASSPGDGAAISDQSNKENWSGIIFEGDTGKVCGKQTLTNNAEIPVGKELIIASGQELKIEAGVTLKNNGEIKNDGTINGPGVLDLSGGGKITGSGTLNIQLKCKVGFSLTNITSTGELAADNQNDYTAELTANNDYALPRTIQVKVNNTVLTAGDSTYSYDPSSGEITIKKEVITGNIEIAAAGVDITTKLGMPTNLTWEGKKATWDSVVDATSYLVKLYKDSDQNPVKSITVNAVAGTSPSYTFDISQPGSYIVGVTAKNEGQPHTDSNEVKSGPQNFYKVSFDTNGGSPIPESQIVKSNGKAAAPTPPQKNGYTFEGWYDNNNFAGSEWDFNTGITTNINLYAKWISKPTGGGSVTYYDIKAIQPAHGTISLSSTSVYSHGSVDVTLTPEAGYQVKDLLINGESVGAVSKYTIKGITKDTVVTAVFTETEAHKNARLKKGVKNTTIKLRSALGKGYIRLNWTKSEGYNVDYYEVFKSTKRYKDYGNKAYWTTKAGDMKNSYKNTKELKKGTRYYYKVRGVRKIGDELVYTKWSNKAWRKVK